MNATTYDESPRTVILQAEVSEFVTHQAGHRIGNRFGAGRKAYTTTRYRNYVKELRAKFGYDGELFEGALEVRMIFDYAVKSKKPKWLRTTRPDLDNLSKSVLDALEGVVFTDDAQVSDLTLSKRNHSLAESMTLTVMVREISDGDQQLDIRRRRQR